MHLLSDDMVITSYNVATLLTVDPDKPRTEGLPDILTLGSISDQCLLFSALHGAYLSQA